MSKKPIKFDKGIQLIDDSDEPTHEDHINAHLDIVQTLYNMVNEYVEKSTAEELKRLKEEEKKSEVLVKEFYMRTPDGNVFVTSDFGNLEPRHGYEAPVCSHSWKPYMGFTENYNYCEHCGVKENEA